MDSGPKKLQEIVAELVEDEELKPDLLIEFAENFETVPERIAKRPYPKEALVPGCESEAYAFAEPEGDGLKFYFAIENPQGISAKSFAAILDEGCSGQPLEAIDAIPADMVYEVFGRNLSMGKGQGLMGMINMLKHLAKQVNTG